jgi:hypothetical protein
VRELGWFLGGVAVGLLHGWTVSWTVGSLHPERASQALLLVMFGALLRTVGVAVVLLFAVTQRLTWGLLAVAGFLVARTAHATIAASRIAHPDRSADEGG